MKRQSKILSELITKYNILADPSNGVPRLNEYGNPIIGRSNLNSRKRFQKKRLE